MDTTNYKNTLIAEKAVITNELSAVAKKDEETGLWHAMPESQSAPEADENDMATRSEDFEERSAVVDTLGSRMRDIENALAKIENNTYGICETCSNKIEEDRLEANPAARKCISCMNKI